MWLIRKAYGIFWDEVQEDAVVGVLELVGKNYRHLNRMRKRPNEIFITQFHQIKYLENENESEKD